MYRGGMLKCFFVFALALAIGGVAVGINAAQPGKKSGSIEPARSVGAASDIDTVLLKNRASVTGKILAEKPDQIVVDLGYTVIVVPRNQVLSIAKAEAGTPVSARSAPTVNDAKSGLYSAAVSPPPERSVRELVQQLGQAVVQVRTPSGLGSGFILNEDGYLITNFHVIENETQISIEVYHQTSGQMERKSYKQVRISAMNKFADLALLKIEDKEAPKFSSVLFGDSDALSVGERVFAIGSPLGLERTVTEGIISTKTRELQGDLYLQTTAQINPGNSGGPLFNLRGEVVGVTNMKITFGEGLGFAIPVQNVKYFLNHRDAFSYDNDNPSNPYRYLEPPSRTRITSREP
jgi:serine protease Do